MTIRTKRLPVLALVCFGLILMSACERDRGTKNAGDGPGVAKEDSPSQHDGDGPAVASAKESLYGEVEPGSVMPEDLGPAAPAIFFLSGLKGYTEPCGCTADVLLGGIDRISGYVEAAKKLHPAVAMVDAGGWLFGEKFLDDHMHPQERAKAQVLADAHRTMGTVVTVPGMRDFALGTAFYREIVARAGMEAIAVNLTVDGAALKGHRLEEVGEFTVAFIGAVDPELYDDLPGVVAGDAAESLSETLVATAGADARVLLFHGELGPAKALLERFEGIDFVVIGHNPRETDQVDEAGNGHTLEAYDQGRYVGVLKLYGKGGAGPYLNALGGSEAERDTVERQIEHVEQSLTRILNAAEGEEEPPMAVRLRERLEGLRERLEAMQTDAVEIPEDRRAFVYRPIPMKPGYPLNDAVAEQRLAFNRSLRELNAALDREPIPPVDGEPFFVGTQECALCHGAAHTFWETTHHSKAVATLEARDKDFDQNCIGCHVVGWEQPGGSVLGQLQYEADLGELTIQKDLRNVGCEACHGPGSEHRLAPLDATGAPQHIIGKPTADQCAQCHVQEHSPGFDFDTYVRRITGEGHRFSGSD